MAFNMFPHGWFDFIYKTALFRGRAVLWRCEDDLKSFINFLSAVLSHALKSRLLKHRWLVSLCEVITDGFKICPFYSISIQQWNSRDSSLLFSLLATKGLLRIYWETLRNKVREFNTYHNNNNKFYCWIYCWICCWILIARCIT